VTTIQLAMLAIPLFVVVGVLFVLVKWLERKQGVGAGRGPRSSEGPLPYEAKGALLTDAELRFLAVLEPAVAAVFGNEARISFQVPVGAVVQVRPGLSAGERQGWRNKVDRKTFDFVVTDARTRVLACVELDDSSHGRADRQERDGFLERVCGDAGVRLVRVVGRQNYDLESVAGVLANGSSR
jgi:hypothetical protein